LQDNQVAVFQYDGTESRWRIVSSSGATGAVQSTNIVTRNYTGNGVTTTYALGATPTGESVVFVFLDGVFQNNTQWTVLGSDLTFATAPANGVAIETRVCDVLTIGTPSDNTVSTAKLQDDAVTAAKLDLDDVSASLQRGEVKSLSGSSVDFTGIPSWVTQIEIGLAGVSHNDVSNPSINLQLGDSGGIETSGYAGCLAVINGGTPASANHLTSSFYITGSSIPAQVISGSVTLTLIDASTNEWAFSSVIGAENAALVYYAGGRKSLSGTLTQLRILPTTGSFDGGKVSVRYR